jgi:VWFA-related protein
MPFRKSLGTRLCRAAAFAAALGLFANAFAQGPGPADEEDEVVRVSSELVQIDLVVLDREGRFVEGLKREDFEVTVDGRPQVLSFFEGVAAGSREESAAMEKARGSRSRASAPSLPGRGRTFLFFVDDLHLAPDSMERTRKSLRRFIDEVMGPEDEAVVATATGQVGFLQQLTNNKAVLRAAVERIRRVNVSVRDGDRPPMSEYLAYLIDRSDRDVLSAFVDQTRKETGLDQRTAEQIVRGRSRALLRQSDALNRNVLLSLMSLMRSAAHYPGRKLAYFFSDGFVPNFGDSHIDDMARRVSDAAARAGVVLYALDPQGLKAGSWTDASQPSFFDAAGRLSGALTREVSATQEPLHTMAQATGGRALVNSNSLDEGLDRAEQETARYYLLAWRPEGASQPDKGFRKLQVRVTGRPELKVLVRSGFFGTPPADEAEREAKPAKNAKGEKAAKPDDELLNTLAALTPKRGVPVLLSAGYERAPAGGTILTASIEVDETALDYGAGPAPQPAAAEVGGVVYDTNGKSAGGFRQRLTVPPPEPGAPERRVTFSNDVPLAPGLYQVRVAVRDARSGRVGSATEWVEVPDLKPGAFSMSSLFLAERAAGAGPGEAVVSPDRRFARTSRLRFMAYVYDAARAGVAPPEVTVKVEVLRGDKPAVAPSESRLAADKAPTPARLTYAADINLGPLAPGRYVLQVTATERASGSSVTRRADFVVL